jgi:hypothetical protein
MTTAYEQLMASLDERLRATIVNMSRAFERIESLEPRLDAALRRIEQLEREVAVLKGPRLAEHCCSTNYLDRRVHGPDCTRGAYAQAVDKKIEAIAKSMELVSTCLDLGIDANGSPLPDEGT